MNHYDSVAEYRQFYGISWSPNPNLALDIVGIPLISVFSLAATAKIFLTLIILGWHVGCTWLGRVVHGRLTRRALLCSFFVYNQQFLQGYVNFMFGMGLCLVVLALWLHSRERWNLWRLGLVTILTTLLFFAHLSGFATLGTAVAIMSLYKLATTRASKRRRIRHLAAGAIPLVPGTVFFFLDFLQKAPAGGGVSFAPLGHNIRDSMTLLTGYNPGVDLASMAVIAVLVATIVAKRPRIAVHGGLCVASLVLGMLYWVSPSEMVSGMDINIRFILGAITLLVFSLDIALPAQVRTAICSAAMALFVARTAVTAGYWNQLDRQFQAHVAAFEHIEKGASVHNIYFYPAPRLFNARRAHGLALIHTLAFAAVTRHANVPTLYGIRGQQPLSHRMGMYSAHRYRDDERPDIPWERVFRTYQYVWTCRAPPDVVAPLANRAEIAAVAGHCTLYRL